MSLDDVELTAFNGMAHNGLLIKGGDLKPEGCGFESWHRIQDRMYAYRKKCNKRN